MGEGVRFQLDITDGSMSMGVSRSFKEFVEQGKLGKAHEALWLRELRHERLTEVCWYHAWFCWVHHLEFNWKW